VLHLILVRHGETEWNRQRRYQGQSDVPLSPLGEQQAKLLGEVLANRKIDAFYASDLKRAWDTAAIIAERCALSVQPEPRLREMKFGVLEGLTWDEAEIKYPQMLRAWLEDYNQPPEGGERLGEFSTRVISFRDELLKKYSDETILLVAHGGPLSELLRLTLDIPPERRLAFALDNASISEMLLGEDEYPLLKKLNDTCHLDSLDN